MLKTYSFRLTLLLLVSCGLGIKYSANLYCYKNSITSITEFSLDDPEPLLNSTCYRSNRKTVFYVSGFTSTPRGRDVHAIIGAYLRVRKVNIILLNWEEEAARVPERTYSIAIINSRKVGKQFGRALIKLNNSGLPLSQVHLVGFSLGVYLVAISGREVQKCGQIIPRITGLDPAGLLPMGPFSVPSLIASDALFVDVINTNLGYLGNGQSYATVDIWPNCGSPIEPECVATAFKNLEPCSHSRSWMYYAESVINGTAFQARFADSCVEWKSGNGGNKTIYWGANIDTTARGKFYMKTTTSSPFGLGKYGSQP